MKIFSNTEIAGRVIYFGILGAAFGFFMSVVFGNKLLCAVIGGIAFGVATWRYYTTDNELK